MRTSRDSALAPIAERQNYQERESGESQRSDSKRTCKEDKHLHFSPSETKWLSLVQEKQA